MASQKKNPGGANAGVQNTKSLGIHEAEFVTKNSKSKPQSKGNSAGLQSGHGEAKIEPPAESRTIHVTYFPNVYGL
jgi:hypothetical protein